MNGAELRRYREEHGWTQDQLGELLKQAIGKGSGTTVGKWEKDQRPVPPEVESFLAQLALNEAYPDQEPGLGAYEEPLDSGLSSSRGGSGDTVPPEPPGERSREAAATAAQAPLPGGGTTYARICTELWELVATGVGTVGAVVGSDALRRDGEIILADSPALGRAWGKLAETNDTLRRILLGATSGGAWLEVAMVTGITSGKIIRAHQERARQEAQAALQAVEAVEEEVRGGDGFPLDAQAAAA